MAFINIVEKLTDFWFASIPRKRPETQDATKARLCAHRGAHDNNQTIQENTDAAFQRALDLGCWGIEFDVHATLDNVLLINHDPTLQRVWGHDITIKKTRFEQIHELEPLIPTLKEVVAKYGKRLHLFIELKSPFSAFQTLHAMLQGLTPGKDYHLLSLDEALFTNLKTFPKEALLFVPIQNNTAKFCRLSIEHGYGGVLGHYLLLRDQHIRQLQAEKQIAGVGFVDSKYSLYRELNRGVHYLFTNNAPEVNRHLNALRLQGINEE